MPSSGMPNPKPASPAVPSPVSQRPQTLKRRISSSFNTFLAALPIRRSSPQISSTLRSSTALGEGVVLQRVVAVANPQAVQHPPVIRLQVPSLSEPSQPCPYDASTYHSFPSVERSRCNFCGMRPPKSPTSEPCNDCRSQSALSHMKSAFRRKPGFKAKEQKAVRSPSRPHHSPSSEEGPRIVPPEIAAKRIGNPPRRAALPVPRPGAINTSLERRNNTKGADVSRRSRSALEREEVRPISPKLHYHRGLPRSKDYPYVRESEVSQHLDAIRAGAPSPLVDFARAARLKKASDRTTDFSKTVFYGQKFSAAFTNSAEQRRSPGPTRTNLVVEGYRETGGHVVVERPLPEQQASIDAQLYHSNVYPRRSSEQSQRDLRASRRSANSRHRTRRRISENESHTSDQRPDFQEGPAFDDLPRLRGGSGGEEYSHTGGCGLMLKQLLLTCHRPGHGYDTDSGSADDLPPARTPNLAEIARALGRVHGTSSLPKGILRGDGSQKTPTVGRSASVGREVSNLPTSRTASFAATYPQPRSVLFCLPFLGLTSIFPRPAGVHFPTVSANRVIQPTTLPPTVSLRGGAGTPSALRDHERVPSMLFWLAGGKGTPITTASWKSQRPKRRMGGFLGMALHGLDAGTEYGTRKGPRASSTNTELPQNVPVAVEADKPATKAKAESVKSNHTRSSRSSSSSSSSVKSHSRHSSRSGKSAAAGGEAPREAPLDPVPEEADAAAPVADPLPPGAAAAEDPPIEVPVEDTPPVEDAKREPENAGAQGDAPALNENENENVGQAAAEGDGGTNK